MTRTLEGVVILAAILTVGCDSRASPAFLAPSPAPAPSPTPPAPRGIVTGTVTKSGSHLPLSDAAVEWAGLAEAWGDRGHGVTTDSSGFYRMNVGPLDGPGSGAGQFLMRASKTGYVSQEVQATLGEMVVVDFTLSPYHDDLGR